MATEARVNTANRFDPDFRRLHSFVWVFALFYAFPYFIFWHYKNYVFPFSQILCFSAFFPNSVNSFCCPYRRKLGLLGLYAVEVSIRLICCRSQYVTSGDLPHCHGNGSYHIVCCIMCTRLICRDAYL